LPNKLNTPYSSEVKGRWPHALQVILRPDEKTLWGKTLFTKYTDNSELIEVCVGVKGGMSASVLAHEATHAATHILKHPDWRDFMPEWSCTYKLEESHAFIIERVVYTGMALCEEYNVRIVNPRRPIKGEQL
jgi:hypothetical protein